MYQPYSPIESVLVVHKIMVEGELLRNHPERHRRSHDIDRPGVLSGLRRTAARGLIALGTRLDPNAGMPAPVASGLRA